MKKFLVINLMWLTAIILFLYPQSLRAQTVWNGTADTTWYDANASSYNINTAEELAGVALLVNLGRTDFSGKTIVLLNDILLNQNAGDTQNNWTPIGGAPSAPGETEGSIKYFRGNVDGNEHTIYNMYCNRSGNFQAGFIAAWGSTADTLTIKDLAFSNPYVTARGMMGVIVGFVSGSGNFRINDCITMNVTIVGNTTMDNHNNIGSILGAGWPNNAPGHVFINRCASTGTLSGNYVGGLTGNTDRTTLTNCYFAGTVTHGYNAAAWGGISANADTCYACYSNSPCGAEGSSGTILTSPDMQSSAFIADLGSSFKMDICSKNGGYPIKSWQAYSVPISGTIELCQGESTVLTASVFDTYQWSTGNTTESITVSPATTTTYYVTGTLLSGTSVQDSVTVTVYPQAIITATAMASSDGQVHGEVTADPASLPCGGIGTVTLTITPDNGYHIAQIVMNDSVLRADDPTDGEVVNYSVDPNGTLADVEVYFSNQYSITATLWSEDTTSFLNAHLLTPWGTDGVYTAYQYSDVEYHFFENARSHIVDVKVNEESQGPIHSYTFSNLDRNGNTVKVYYQDTCGILTLPFADNFDSYAGTNMPDCWSRIGNTGSFTYPRINTNTGYSASNSLSFLYNGTSYAILPVIDTLVYPINTLQVSYQLYTGSTSVNFEVGVMTDPTDAATFTSISSLHNTAVSTWQSHTVYLSNFTGHGQFIAFKWSGTPNTYTDFCYMDDLEISVAPDCSPVSDVTITDVTFDNVNYGSATVNWKPGVIGTPISYTLEYKTPDETDWTPVSSITDTTYPLIGLLPATRYDVRVASDCGTSTMSDWTYASCAIPCDSLDRCTYTLVLSTSSPVVSWYDASVDVYLDGELAHSYTPPGSSAVTYSFSVCEGSNMELKFGAAQNTYYHQYFTMSLTNPFGIELFTCPAGTASSYTDNQVIYAATAICQAPQCLRPDSVAAVGGVTTADISWMDAGTTSQKWIIEYGPEGFTLGTGIVEEAYSSPYTLHNLDPNTHYSVFVRTFCGEGDTSNYTDRVNFRTYFCEEVDRCNYSFSLTNEYNGDGFQHLQILVGDSLYETLEFTSASTIVYEVPLCNNGDTVSLVFLSYYGTGVGDYGVYASFSLMDPFGEQELYSFSSGAGLNGTTIYSFVPNCTPPICPRPTALQASSVTQTSADLGWTEMGTAGSWIIEYDTTGFTHGTGIVATSSSNSYPLTGLTSSTSYDVYVRADCGSGDTSVWSGVYTFSTACGDITSLPFTENFDGNNISDNYLNCWTRYTSNSEHVVYVTDNNNAYSAPRVLDFHYTPNCFVMAVLPAFDNSISVNALTVTFQSRTADNTAGVKEIGLLSDPNDTTTYQRVAILNHSANDTWEEFEIPLTAYTGTGSAIAFKYSNGGNNQFLIDNVEVDYTPSCISPVNLTASNPTASSVDLSWTERGTATAWAVEYGSVGFMVGQGTIVAATTNPFTVTGLTAETTYDFYVRAVCSATDSSSWSNVASGTTDTAAVEPCTAPSNVVASNLTASGATLSWTPAVGTDAAWNVEYGVIGFAQGNGNSLALTTPTTTLAGLLANTTYQVYVQTNCGNGNTSSWVGPTNFSTTAEAACPMPTDLVVTAVDSNSATIAWTQEAGTATEWTINYKRTDAAEWTISTATANPYTIAELTSATDYEVQIRANCANGLYSEYTDAIAFTTTGINNYNLSNSISLYPNPTTSYIDVKFSDNIQVSELKVYDVYGKLLQTITVNENPTRINVSSLADGVYFVRVITEDGVANKSFIKR